MDDDDEEHAPDDVADRQAMDDWTWLELREKRKKAKAEQVDKGGISSAQRPR